MKKYVVIAVSAVLTLSSCGTYAGSGAYTGSTFGSILGSAIGGITGGPRGSDIGTIVGMAGGAVVGAAIGSAADKAQDQRAQDRVAQRRQAQQPSRQQDYDDFDPTNSGDDRVDWGPTPGDTYSATPARPYTPQTTLEGYAYRPSADVVIRHARIVDANRDGVLTRGEQCQVVFEIMNNSSRPLYDVQPLVLDMTGNKHLHISPNLHVESIRPHQGVRYTATILADNRLKDGEAVIRVAVAQGNRQITSQVKEFRLVTRRK